MHKLVSLVCVLGLSCVSFSQANHTSDKQTPPTQAAWSRLSALHAGQKIQVVDTTSKKHTGTFISVSDTAIVYGKNTNEESIQRQDVQTIKLMENKHRLRNTLIVAAAGAGVGAGIGAAAHKGCSPATSFCLDIGGRAIPAAIGAVVGGVGGAVVGAVLPSHDTIYDSRTH
jgi:hypothetical protein